MHLRRAVADTQNFMATFGQGINGPAPFFFPVAAAAQLAE